MQGFHRASWRGKFSPGGGPRHREGPRARIVKPRTTGIKPAPWMIEGGENGAIGGTGHGGLLPSTDDVVYVTGGLHSCSGPTGLGGVPRSADAEIANPFVLTFLDSGALLKCVHRFSGRAFRQGTVGVAVRGIRHGSCLLDVDPVPPAFIRVRSLKKAAPGGSPNAGSANRASRVLISCPTGTLPVAIAFGALIRAVGPSSQALPRRSWCGATPEAVEHSPIGNPCSLTDPLTSW